MRSYRFYVCIYKLTWVLELDYMDCGVSRVLAYCEMLELHVVSSISIQ